MSRVKRIPIGADTHFEDLWSNYEKYAWLVMGTILIAGLLGILGRGPLARRHVISSVGTIAAMYDVVARNATPATLELSIGPAGMRQPLRIRFRSNLLEKDQLSATVPRTAKTELAADGGAEWFTPTTPEVRNVTATEEPGAPRTLWYHISLNSGPSIRFRHLTLP